MINSMSMKKFFAIIVLALLWGNVLLASQVQSLLDQGYELKTTHLSDNGWHLIYNLTRTISGKETIKTCIFSLKDAKLEVCFSP